MLNVGILGLATGLLKFDDQQRAPAVIYGLYLAGALCCGLALVAGRVQRAYYRQTKAHKAKLEALLGLDDLAIKTTPGMGGTARTIAKVTTFHTLILTVILALDIAGIGYAADHKPPAANPDPCPAGQVRSHWPPAPPGTRAQPGPPQLAAGCHHHGPPPFHRGRSTS